MNAPQILVVDDEPDIRTLIDEILTDEGYAVQTAGNGSEARRMMAEGRFDLVLLDIWMPDVDGITLLGEWSAGGLLRCPVIVMSGHGTVETAVEATRLGALDFVEKPLSLQKLLHTVEKALATRGGRGAPARQRSAPVGPLGRSAPIHALRERASALARLATPALVVGESGAGRESVARLLHEEGGRADAPFVRVIAASVPAENAATLLFGAQTPRGAEPGWLERADAGTLYLGDLQDLCAPAQALLLGVIDEGRYVPVGRAESRPLACRIVASLLPDADADPQARGLRADLLARFAPARIQVPPLRDYAQDIPELLRQTVDQLVEAEGLPYRRFSLAAQNRLRNYPWPGNVGELRQLVRHVLGAGGTEEVGLAEVENSLAAETRPVEPLVKQDLLSLPLREAREQFERAYLTQQLSLCGGKVGQLAKRVGMERTHLYRKLRALGVDFRQSADD